MCGGTFGAQVRAAEVLSKELRERIHHLWSRVCVLMDALAWLEDRSWGLFKSSEFGGSNGLGNLLRIGYNRLIAGLKVGYTLSPNLGGSQSHSNLLFVNPTCHHCEGARSLLYARDALVVTVTLAGINGTGFLA